MRILFVSETGLSLGLAMRCESDGHDVNYLTKTRSGHGLVKTPTDQPDHADLLVFDSNQYASQADSMRGEGLKVLGPSRWSSMLSSDGNYRSQILLSLGLPVGNLPSGTNLYVSAWFNGASFISTYTSIVYRRFMSGGVGPDLSCTGMLGSFQGLTTKTRHHILTPLEKMLKKVNHRGPIHIHTRVSGDQFAINDINASFIHPLSLLLYENTTLTTSEILLRLFDETSKPIVPLDAWSCGVQVSIPPYPYAQGLEPTAIRGIIPANLKHLWLADVSYKDGYWAQERGLVGYVTARGHDENEAVRRMYRTVGNLKAGDLQYRNDVGRGAQGLIQALRQASWLD